VSGNKFLRKILEVRKRKHQEHGGKYTRMNSRIYALQIILSGCFSEGEFSQIAQSV
jgi:hypothetical protein